MSSETNQDLPGRERRCSLRLWLEVGLIAALALTLNLAGNDRTSLWDRDEPRYAVCTREMRARGDWIYPTFNSEPRFQKPVLIYWLMRISYAVGGDCPFGARLVSVTAGTATSLLVLALGRRMFGSRVGFLASIMLTTAPIMVIESKLATTDATLTFLLVATQFCLWDLSLRESKMLAATFWVLMGLSTLTKGPIGPALIASAGLISWWAGGPSIAWRRLRWSWGVPLMLSVIAPWFVAVGIQSRGEFFRVAIGKQIAERIMTGMEQHDGFPGYYLVTSLLTFHPWSALLPAAFFGAWTRRHANNKFGFLIGWVIGPLILLECVRTKLIHYYLPAFPACALLVAWLVEMVVRERGGIRYWPLGRIGLAALGVVGLGVTVTFFAGVFFTPDALRWPLVLTALITAGGTCWGLSRFYQFKTDEAVRALAITWSTVLLLLSAWVLPAAEPFRTSPVIGRRLARIVDEYQVEPVLLAFQEPSVIYAMGRSATFIRTWDQFYAELDEHGEVLTALIEPRETREFARRTELEVRVLETIDDFNMNKGAKQTLKIALIRRKPDVSITAVADRPRSEQLLVK